MNNSDRLDPIDHKRCEALEDLLEASKSLHYAVRVLDKTAAYIKAAPRLPAQGPSERDCTCLGTCKGAEGLAPGWRCALTKTRNAPAPQGSASPAPDDEMVGFPYRTPEDEEISYSQEAAEQAREAAAEPPGAEAGPGLGDSRQKLNDATAYLLQGDEIDELFFEVINGGTEDYRKLKMKELREALASPAPAADEREAFTVWKERELLPHLEAWGIKYDGKLQRAVIQQFFECWQAAHSTPPSGGRT